MDIGAKSLAHLSPPHIRNSMQRQAIIQLIIVQQIFPDTVNNKVEQLMLLVKEKSDGQVSNLLFRVFGGGYEIDSFQVAEIDVPSEDVDVEELNRHQQKTGHEQCPSQLLPCTHTSSCGIHSDCRLPCHVSMG